MLGFLILFPLVVAAVLFVVKNNQARKVIVSVSALVIGLASVLLAGTYLGAGGVYFEYMSPVIDYVCTGISILIAVVILAYGVKYRNVLASVLAIIQVVGTLVLEFGFAHHVTVQYGLYLALVIGIIGSGICVYAIGYMEDFQAHHADEPDRRPTFFALMFLFLSAMFGIVFSNNMMWLFAAWEVTTVCSFLLIGYTKTDEAIKNAFRQIIMNILGGLGFLGALYFMVIGSGTLSFVDFIVYGIQNPAVVVLPVTCLAFAGITNAVSYVASGRHGRPDPHKRAAAFVHHGEGRRLPARQARTHLLCGHCIVLGQLHDRRAEPHGRARGRHHVHAVLVHGHLPEQRQARARVFDHCEPRPHRGMRRCRHA